MTQEANTFEFASGGIEVAVGLERFLTDTNNELNNFREEQSQLRAQVSAVLEENQRLTTELGKLRQSMRTGNVDEMNERLRITGYALNKAMGQVDDMRKDRFNLASMQECSQRTIENLELEIKNYRAQLNLSGDDTLNKKYIRTVKLLEEKISAQQQELKNQSEMIKALHQHKQKSGDQLEKLQAKIKKQVHTAHVMDESQNKIVHLQKQIKEYEKSLKHTRNLLIESTKRESTAMCKVQDAIQLSEAAMQAKESAEKRAEGFKEEATQLATNIGCIMDEAAKRVDTEVEQLKDKLKEKDKSLAALREKFHKDIKEHKDVVKMLETRNTRLEMKYKEALQQNEKLAAEVEISCKRLNKLERCATSEEVIQEKIKKDYDSRIKKYLEAHKDIKLKYKAAIKDLTQKFEDLIYRLKLENSELLAENQTLKSGAVGDCHRQPQHQSQ
ncbi:uncharacterized protein [Drosophila tropicalis]|uniref:uncharacterized protein n=1 Tax=Drosophila tropicalis TaxID=46794 RepID=UPI0035AC064F